MDDYQPTVLTKVTNGWVPKGESVIIANRKIPGMIYICDSSKGKLSNVYLQYDFCINAALHASRHGYEDVDPGTLSYAEMNESSRGAYLDWLAYGREDSLIDKAYPRVYLHGLEHRLLNDPAATEEEKQDIIDELRRMRKDFKGVNDIDNMARDILNFAELRRNPAGSKLISYPNRHFQFPVKLLVDLSRSIAAGDKLTADQMFEWLLSIPLPRVGKSAIKDMDRREKFVRRFESEYGDGLAVESPESFINLEYSALSGEFKIVEPFMYEGSPVLDIRYLNKPLHDAYKIAQYVFSVMGDPLFIPLYWMRRAGSLRHCRTKRWKVNQYQLYNFVRIWASAMHERKIIFPARYFIKFFVGPVTDKISVTHWTKAERELERIGFGVTPNCGLYLDAPKRNCPSMIYDLNNWTNEKPKYSPKYFALLNQLGICSHIIHILELNTDESKSKLEQYIGRISKLTRIERAGLHAHVEYIMDFPPDKAYMTRFRKWVEPEIGDVFRPIIIDLVRGKRQLEPATVSLFKKIYKNLLLDPQLALSDLHAGEVILNAKGKEKSIPKELDKELIAKIKSDTESVSKMLGDIFATDGQVSQQSGTASANSPNNQNKITVVGLDNKHAEFLIDLLEQEFWPEDAFDKMAKQHGLLPVGAAETINEWSFERFEDALLEEHEGFHVAPEIAATLKAELSKRA